jgi:hypothetical protein
MESMVEVIANIEYKRVVIISRDPSFLSIVIFLCETVS